MRSRLAALVQQFIPTGSVRKRTVRSGMWSSAINISSRVLQILMLIILARLLEPRDFGLLGIALVTLTAVQQFSKIGLNAALIQKVEKNVDAYLDTTWCLEAGRGIVIVIVLVLSAPLIGQFFNEPAATPLIQAIAIGPLLLGLQNPGIVYFRKDLEFHKEFLYYVSGGLAQFVVGVGYALVSPTVWALIFAFIAGDACRFLLSYLIHPYRPRPRFNRSHAMELIHYGKWITAGSIIYFLYRQGDDAFVGWYLSATSLGFYQYAYQIADTPSTEVAEIISKVSFPAYSQLQTNQAQLQEAILATTRVTAFVTMPMAMGIALVAPSFVPVVLGPDWSPMILTMQLLALYGLCHAITRNFGSIWKAIDRPDLIAKMGAIRVTCIAIFIWPATAQWGIEGTALVVVGVFLVPMVPLDTYLVSRTTGLTQRAIYREWVYPLTAAGSMFITVWYGFSMLGLSPLFELLLVIPSGVAVYLFVSLVLNRAFEWEIDDNLRTIVGELR